MQKLMHLMKLFNGNHLTSANMRISFKIGKSAKNLSVILDVSVTAYLRVFTQHQCNAAQKSSNSQLHFLLNKKN